MRDDKERQQAQNGGAEGGARPSDAAVRAADLAYQKQLAREKSMEGASAAKKTRKKARMSTIKKAIIGVLLVLLAVSGVLIGKFIYDINNPSLLFENPAPLPTPVALPTPEKTPEAKVGDERPVFTPTPTPDPEAQLLSQADLEFMKNRVNILMLGLDESTERANWGSYRTDTMILLTINFETNDVDMISVPRDSYVKICGASGNPIGKYGKVNSAFPSGGGAKKSGYAYAMGTVSYLLGGIPVQYYVGFNMNVVKEVVDAMGGVYYDVDIEVKMNGRELHPGMQFMDGQAVLDYCRQRKGSSDVERVDRQQRMLTAIFRQVKSSGQIANIPAIYQAVEQNIQTNLSFTQISALALLAVRMDLNQLDRHMVEGEFMNLYKTSYWGVHTGKVQSMVQEVFGISARVDGDINASNVRARVEEARALIAAELNAANSAIRTAEGILNSYSEYLPSNVVDQLKAHKARLEDAVDDEDKALLDAYTPPLVQMNNYALSLLGQMPQQPVQTAAPEEQFPSEQFPSEQDPGYNDGSGIPQVPLVQ